MSNELIAPQPNNLELNSVHLKQELGIDISVKTVSDEESSMLIRKTTPAGQISSTLLHIINKKIKVIPSFSSFAGEALEPQHLG